MKKYIALFLIGFLFQAVPVFSQKYKSADDTIKLNREYEKLSADIVELNIKINTAENDLASYQSKARSADNDATSAASASSDQASKATNGSVRDAKTAKRKAKKAYSEAIDSRSANNKVSDQQKRIMRFRSDLLKKQKRMEELQAMRLAIDAKIAAGQ